MKDYRNVSVLACTTGISDTQSISSSLERKMQKVQNSAGRLILGRETSLRLCKENSQGTSLVKHRGKDNI